MDETAQDTLPAPRPPEGHVLLAPAGAGARSLWFKAEQQRLGRIVALKFLRPALAESDIFRDAFFSAGRQAAAIVHHAALPIINLYPKEHCIAVQWCKGLPLGDCAFALGPFRAAHIGATVMDCLSALHATGRCHGNLSPGNIFLDDECGVWVDDFFQPPFMDDSVRRFEGDRRFMAPEFLQSGRLDWRTDVFSLGCVLDTLLDPRERPRELAGVIEAMRALDPARRGVSPEQVREALQRVRRLEESRRSSVLGKRQTRRYRRIPAEFAVSLTRRSATPGETAVILNKIRDIGENGVFIETEDELLTVGSILELNFALRGERKEEGGKVHAFGIVRWKSSPPLAKGVGVQFLEVDQEGLRKLRQFLRERD